jgi:hypothetical protein
MIIGMSELWSGGVEIGIGRTQILVGLDVPSILGMYQRNAELVEDFPAGDENQPAGYAFVAVGDGGDWPRLVVTQRFTPAVAGFAPGVLLAPEQRQVFIGAGTRLLAYDDRGGQWRRTWEDEADCGFWSWSQHEDVVLMSAELELAAWTTDGRKLWTISVEPPWSYRVTEGRVVLDVMGEARDVDLHRGR